MSGLIGLTFLLVAALAMQAPAQSILIDDFNDGDANGWSIIDTTIGDPYGPGTFEVSRSGAYHFEGGGLINAGVPAGGALAALWDESADPIFTDGFVRAKVRSEALGGLAAIMLRHTPDNSPYNDNLYIFHGTTANNGIPGNGAFRVNKIVNGRDVQSRQLPGNFSFGVNEDWYIEAGAVGDQLSMKVWRVGEPEPESPQWTFTDSRHTTGDIGIIAAIDNRFRQPARVSATFDNIYFVPPDFDNSPRQ